MPKTFDDLLVIKNELQNDPAQIGLTNLAQDDARNAALLNQKRTQIQRRQITPEDLLDLLELNDWLALDAKQIAYLQTILNQDSIDMLKGEIRSNLLRLFPSNSQTRNRITQNLKESASRISELYAAGSLSTDEPWTPSDVANARKA